MKPPKLKFTSDTKYYKVYSTSTILDIFTHHARRCISKYPINAQKFT